MKHIKLFESNKTELNYFNKGLTSLPELPNSLERLYCENNNLISLPELPNSLERLYCEYNKLTHLPELPNSLETLFCHNNKLTSLPTLPNSLKELYCYNNKLTSLPELPNSLNYLYCYNNPFELPLSKDIIEKFNLNNEKLYTVDRLEEFKIIEWQRDFLNEYPERFMDIDWVVLPQIKQEFDYLYTSEELGLL